MLFIQSGGDSWRQEGAVGDRGGTFRATRTGLRAVEDIGQGGLEGHARPSALPPCK